MKYDLAAYVWPAYTGDEIRTRIFWPEGIGEWEIVKNRMKQKPLWGYCNEADSKVMERQIDTAIKYGVNVFIYDWYWYDHRPFLENCLNDGFLKAKNNKKMKFYIMWANHSATYLWDIRNSHIKNVLWDGKVSYEDYKIIVDRWTEFYFSKDNYYKIENRPVVSIYDIQNFIDSFGTLEKIENAIKYLDDKCKELGFDGIHLQFIKQANDKIYKLENKNYSFDEIIEKVQINSFTHYQAICFINNDQDYEEIYPEITQEYNYVTKIANNAKIKYYPHVSVGWNDQPRFLIPKRSIKNCNKQSIKRAMEMAKEYADKNNVNLITINSWNEWTENSYLEPDDINGFDYLEVIEEVFKY